MKIVVLVKHVPDATGERGFAADGTVDRAATDGLLSELDEYAVEQALQLAEAGDGRRGGGDDAGAGRRRRRDQARRCRWGRPRASTSTTTRCTAPTPWRTSAILAAAIRKAEPDLVICGMASTDGSMGVLPSMIAERLGWPAATMAADAGASGRHGHHPARR